MLRRRKSGCKKIRDLLSEYINKTLNDDEQVLVEQHLDICEACSKQYQSLLATVNCLNRVPLVEVPRSFAIREVEAVSGAGNIFHPEKWRWLRPATALVAVALIAVLCVDFLMLDGGGGLYSASDQTAFGPPIEQGANMSGDRNGLLGAASTPEPVPERDYNNGTAIEDDATGGKTVVDFDYGNKTGEVQDIGTGVWKFGNLTLPGITDRSNITDEANATNVLITDFGNGNGTRPEEGLNGNITEDANSNSTIERAQVPGSGDSGFAGHSGMSDGGTTIAGEGGSLTLRIIEIALGMIVFLLVTVIVFGRIRRRAFASV